MTITIDLPPEVADALERKAAQEGRDVAGYVRQIAVRASDGHTAGQGAPALRTPALRTPGLHAGRYWIADDFDAPLPDNFWLGEEGQARTDGG